MLNWITSNIQVVSAAINLVMLMVWLAYLHVFLSNFRRNTRSKIMISLSGDCGFKSTCLVTNMSSEAIYIQSIIIDLEAQEGRRSYPITEIESFEKWAEPSDLKIWSRQGPLGAGQARNIGTFEGMLAHAIQEENVSIEAVERQMDGPLAALEIRVIAAYASEDLPVGAVRKFRVLRSERGPQLRAESSIATQIRSRRERRAIKELLNSEFA